MAVLVPDVLVASLSSPYPIDSGEQPLSVNMCFMAIGTAHDGFCPLSFLKPTAFELQRARILGDRAHNVVGRAVGQLGLDV